MKFYFGFLWHSKFYPTNGKDSFFSTIRSCFCRWNAFLFIICNKGNSCIKSYSFELFYLEYFLLILNILNNLTLCSVYKFYYISQKKKNPLRLELVTNPICIYDKVVKHTRTRWLLSFKKLLCCLLSFFSLFISFFFSW